MNFCVRNRKPEQGGVLIVTFFILTSIFIALGSYLMLVRAQYVSIVRSHAWNDSMAMAEAGAEDALAQLNPGAINKTLTVDRSANGWGSPSGGLYGPVSRTVQSGASYAVVFSTNAHPIIYSTGYVTIPDISATVQRIVRVATTNVPLYNAALAGRTNITLSGNGLSANSFDSSNTNLSSNGRYDSSKTGTNGDVAVLYGTLDLGNHTVSGDVYLGPTATLTSPTNQVTGNIYHDFNSDFPDVTAPNTSGWLNVSSLGYPAAANIVSISNVPTTFNYVFTNSGDYIISSMLGTGNIYVGTNAHVRLLINGGNTTGVTVDGNGGANAGQLMVYVNTGNFTIGGLGEIDGGKAANLSYFGLSGNTNIVFSGNAGFVGTIYAPDASLTLNGGGSNDYDFIGSAVARSVTITGHFHFHFDEDLLNSGASRGYIAVSWTEL